MNNRGSVDLPDGSRLERLPGGSFKRWRRVWARHGVLSGFVRDDNLADLTSLDLPGDMINAIAYLGAAKKDAQGSREWRRHEAALQRYARDASALETLRETRKGSTPVKQLSADLIANAFELATRLQDENPRLSKDAILGKVADRLGCGKRTLERYNVRPIPTPGAT